MVRKNNTTLAKLFSLLAAVILCLTVFTVPVLAEDSDESTEQKDGKSKLYYLQEVDTDEVAPAVVEPIFEDGIWDKVHSNPGTFEKNLNLSPELKEYSIKKYQEVVSDILEPDMSDLEKYYTLAIWLNRLLHSSVGRIWRIRGKKIGMCGHCSSICEYLSRSGSAVQVRQNGSFLFRSYD